MSKPGFGLIAVIFIMLVFSVLAAGFVSLIFSEARLAVEEYRYSQAYYLADSGIRFAVQHLTAYPDWSVAMGFPLSRALGRGFFTVNASVESGSQLTLMATGLLTEEGRTYSRTASVNVSINTGTGFWHDFDYAFYAGPPSAGATLRVGGTAGIYGNFYYNGPIRLEGSSHQQDGVIYSTSLAVYGGATYASWEALTPVELPVWDNTYYDSILSLTANPAQTSLNLGWGQTLNLNNQTLYYSGITVNWGATINGPGRLVSTEDITINYGAGIGQGISFVAADDFIYQGGSSLSGSIEVYAAEQVIVANNLIVPGNSVLYSRSSEERAIEISGTANANLLAPYGQVYMHYGAIRGLIYADRLRTANSGEIRGGIIAQSSSTIQGSFNLYYDAAYLPPGLEGLGGTGDVPAEAGVSLTGWHEVY